MSVQACADLVARADPDRFLAAMAAPLSARAVLFPLYALNVEVSRAPWVTAEPMIAEMRLQFWRDMAADIAAGNPPRGHEVAGPLAAVVAPGDAPLIDALVAARRWDIYTDAFADQVGFDAYIEATAGHLMWLAAKALGAGPGAEAAVRDRAHAAGVATFLRAIPALEAKGRVPLLDGTPRGVRDLADRALARLTAAQAARTTVPRAAGPALYAGWRARATLTAARDTPDRVIDGTLDESEFARRGRLLWVSLTGRW